LTVRGSFWLSLTASVVGAAACAGVEPTSGTGPGGSAGIVGMGGRAGVIGTGGMVPPPIPPCVGLCTDFPRDPYFDVGVSHDVTGMFGTPSAGPGPCVTEPEDGALFPNNWLRPRVRVPGSTGVLKITFHSDKQANDLVAYTTGESWAMPKDVWTKLASHVVDQDITVTVQAPTGGVTSVRFKVAPVSAGGSMVFWAANPAAAGKTGVENMPQKDIAEDSMLMGFTVGDESTIPTLKITDVAQPVALQDGKTQGSHCIGCHTGTPDGDYVAFVDAWPWGAAFAGVKPGITGAALPGFTGGPCRDWNNCDAPKTFVQYPWNGPMTFSPAHWAFDDLGERMAIIATQVQDITMPWGPPVGPNWQPGRLAWVDLRSTATTTTNGQTNPTRGVAWDYLARTGDPHPAAAFPTWSRDGASIVYVSVACPNPGQQNGCGTQDGRLYKGDADLYEIPYANKAGGVATPVAGASSPDDEEYYPAFSPDDKLIAFTRVKLGQEMFANPSAEMWVVRHHAGDKTQAQRLAANDPPVCSGKKSPGVNNHWPKWSPDRSTVGNKTYYWMIFSSNRYGLPPVTTSSNGQTKIVQVSQLYITAVVTDLEKGVEMTYPAIYLWNQPQSRLNTTPAWDNFHIPIVID
jgi:WD40-like Beta Propeller Repeat